MAGIVNLKIVGVDLAKFGMRVEEALEDKKLSFPEAIALGVFAAPRALGHVSNAQEIKEEFKDLDQSELEELVDHVAEELNLANDKVENIIEAGLDWIAATNNLRLTIQEARQ